MSDVLLIFGRGCLVFSQDYIILGRICLIIGGSGHVCVVFGWVCLIFGWEEMFPKMSNLLQHEPDLWIHLLSCDIQPTRVVFRFEHKETVIADNRTSKVIFLLLATAGALGAMV